MLIQFTVENFLSFRDEVTFSMVAVNSDSQHSDHLAQNEAGEGRSALPIAAIYGANAAGKSNLIKAMSFVQDLVVRGTRSGQIIPVSTFKLGNYSNQPSKFELIFTYEGSQYSYGFRLNREQILEEWLYGIPKGKKKEIKYFERVTSTSTNKETNVIFGVVLKGKSTTKDISSKRYLNLQFIAKGTRFNQLFLTEAVDRSVKELMPIFNWFKKVLTIIPAEVSCGSGLEAGVYYDESFTDFLSKFLKSAGTGIDSILAERVDLDADRLLLKIPQSSRDVIVRDLDKRSEAIVGSPQGGRIILSKGIDGQMITMSLTTRHRTENGTLVDFDIDEESEGTQRLIHLIPALFLLKQEPEKVVFLDELDRRLHPLLSRYFIETSINCRSKNNQLIFTTHDTNLLDLDLLRRDEIWLVEKNQYGVSSCYSLAEFKIRPDLKVAKGYLNGRFGAIPFLGDPKKLGWTEHETILSSTNP